MRLVRWLSVVAVALAAGCQTAHYMVVQERTPLFAAAEGDAVLDELPLYHHAPLPRQRHEGERLFVRYKDKEGYVEREGVRLFRYLSPSFDGGEARDRTVARELREAQLAEVGEGWPSDVVRAIRREQVVEGMTRRQVELAWGWPVNVEAGRTAGEERWIYEVRVRRVVRHYLEDPWPTHLWGHLPSSYSWHWHPHWASQGWIDLRVPFIEKRIVTIGADGAVQAVRVERYPCSAS